MYPDAIWRTVTYDNMLFYSVLLLAAAKPACDYIVKIVAKNTNDKIDQVTTILQTTRTDMLDEIERLVVTLNEGNMSRDEVLSGLADLLSKQVNRTNELGRDIADLKRQKKHMSPSKLSKNDSSSGELQKIHKELAEVKRIVLEDRTNFHEPAKSNITQVIDDCKSGFADVHDVLLKNRAAAHNDALSLHTEHVQLYKL